MIFLTMIARVADGLPLAASMQENDQVGMESQLLSPNPFDSRLPFRDPISMITRYLGFLFRL